MLMKFPFQTKSAFRKSFNLTIKQFTICKMLIIIILEGAKIVGIYY